MVRASSTSRYLAELAIYKRLIEKAGTPEVGASMGFKSTGRKTPQVRSP